MLKLLSILFLSTLLFAQNSKHISNTTILNDDVNISIGTSGELNIAEKLEIQPRNLYDGMIVDNPLISLVMPNMLHSKSAIRNISRGIGNFSIELNGMPVMWKKDIFNKDEPNEKIRIRLQTNYLTDLLTDKEKQKIDTMPKKYIYTIHYTVKKSVVEASKNGLDKIAWKIFKNNMIGFQNIQK